MGVDAVDEWFSDETESPERAEPNCFDCNDDGWVISWRGTHPCPACHPTRLDVIRNWVYVATWRARQRVRRLRPGHVEEPPL